jgi:nucleotide-binding universal stress UspA family protein
MDSGTHAVRDDHELLRLLLVGVDGSAGSRRAVEWAAWMAAGSGASVLAVHVLTYDTELLRDFTFDTMRTWRIELEHDVRTSWVAPLHAAGIPHRCIVVENDSPSAGLVAMARQKRADLVVVGAQGHGNLAERVLGGVTYRLAHRASQPVVVVPPDWSGSAPLAARGPVKTGNRASDEG